MRQLKPTLQTILLGLLFLPLVAVAAEKAPGFECPDQQIKQNIINDSIKNYKGDCPCPYSVDKSGKTCGDQSAYSSKGIAAAFCYNSDISDEMVQEKCKDFVL